MVDNFVIRYANEDTMRKWYKDIDGQRALQADQRTLRSTGTSDSEFLFMKGVANLTNPYQEEYDAEEQASKEAGFFSEFPMSRNPSSSNLRTRSATGGSGGSGSLSGGRPPRFPMPDPTLSVHTQLSNGSMSPGERNVSSYFSPMTEAAPSTRSSSQSTGYSYGRTSTPSNNWHDESNRHTAPALTRMASRESTNSNSYFPAPPSSRNAQRPSLQHNQTSNGMAQRMRSASSPDIHHHNNGPERRYMANSIDNVPVPPIPAHMASMRAPVNRSQTSSPTSGTLPIRSATGTPNGQSTSHPTQFNEPQYSESGRGTPLMMTTDHPPSPMTQEPEADEPFMPTQLKAKINFDENYVTLVIASNILFRSLTDRVDAKLSRFTNRSIGNKSVRLRYRDEDGDFVTIDSDEAVQLAFMEWREQHRDMLSKGQVGEIQLYCQAVEN